MSPHKGLWTREAFSGRGRIRVGLADRVPGLSWEKNDVGDPDGRTAEAKEGLSTQGAVLVFEAWLEWRQLSSDSRPSTGCLGLGNSHLILWGLLWFNPASKDL